MRLAQTSKELFTLRHLIVGMGCGPIGADKQVECAWKLERQGAFSVAAEMMKVHSVIHLSK